MGEQNVLNEHERAGWVKSIREEQSPDHIDHLTTQMTRSVVTLNDHLTI